MTMTKLNLPQADDSGVTTVKYEAKKIGPGGTNRDQVYIPIKPPKDDVKLSYEVFFPKDFDFNRGGKLPGIASAKAVSGGNKASNDYSVRLMWRRNGQGEAYVYVPPRIQKREYAKACTESNPVYGDSVGRGSFSFERGEWNKVTIRTKLNDEGKSNGILQVFHNGKKEIDVNCVTFRSNDKTKTCFFMFSTFFGGSTSEWAPDKDQTAKFRNFVIDS